VGLLFVGDSQMSALEIRAHIHPLKQHYLCPLALTGKAAEEMERWIAAANDGSHPLQSIYVENECSERKLLAVRAANCWAQDTYWNVPSQHSWPVKSRPGSNGYSSYVRKPTAKSC